MQLEDSLCSKEPATEYLHERIYSSIYSNFKDDYNIIN
jgi:hypothetical protein